MELGEEAERRLAATIAESGRSNESIAWAEDDELFDLKALGERLLL